MGIASHGFLSKVEDELELVRLSQALLLLKIAFVIQLLFAPAIIPAIVGTLTYWECKSMQITKEKIEKVQINDEWT